MRFIVVGAAGQARETEYYLHELGHVCLGFVVTDLAQLRDRYDSRERVVGDLSWLDAHLSEVDGFALGIGTPAFRALVAHQLKQRFPRMPWPPLIHPSVSMDRKTTTVAEGVVVGPSSTLTVNVVLKEFCLINFGVTIGHDSRIEEFSVVNPGANLGGGVVVGESALVGAGAVILQYCRIGTRAIVGAGAVVTRDVPPDVTVVGVPARIR